MAKPKTGVQSGMVRTVLGPIPVDAMGVTLMHEHTLLDTSSWWKRPCCASDIGFAERPIEISMTRAFCRIRRSDRRRPDERRHRPRPVGAATYQPARGPQYRHGRGLLS